MACQDINVGVAKIPCPAIAMSLKKPPLLAIIFADNFTRWSLPFVSLSFHVDESETLFCNKRWFFNSSDEQKTLA